MKWLVALALLTNCSAPSKIVIAPISLDAAPMPDGGDGCDEACAKLSAAGCQEGRNQNCPDACHLDQAQGTAAQLDPACVLSATTRDELLHCGVRCVQ